MQLTNTVALLAVLAMVFATSEAMPHYEVNNANKGHDTDAKRHANSYGNHQGVPRPASYHTPRYGSTYEPAPSTGADNNNGGPYGSPAPAPSGGESPSTPSAPAPSGGESPSTPSTPAPSNGGYPTTPAPSGGESPSTPAPSTGTDNNNGGPYGSPAPAPSGGESPSTPSAPAPSGGESPSTPSAPAPSTTPCPTKAKKPSYKH
ncbi:hypothetical protein BDF22DRAFT_744331 [Syncephalis plumigaleata]|nr:hypothetical protein BDF22DRAFT_744331 [Syncephalis plumigaleata]